jgi:hypothetical protein
MTSNPRFYQISPELLQEVRQCTNEQRENLVARACSLALERTDLVDRRLSTAIRAKGEYSVLGNDSVAEISSLVRQLDEKAWTLQDQVERGEAEEREYLSAFAKARACAAVEFSLGRTEESDLESLYEAYHAIGDRGVFVQLVTAARTDK